MPSGLAYLQGRQAVVVRQLLSLLVTQVLDTQAEPELLQRHRGHVVGHVIDLRVQRERWEGLRTHDTSGENNVCTYVTLTYIYKEPCHIYKGLQQLNDIKRGPGISNLTIQELLSNSS